MLTVEELKERWIYDAGHVNRWDELGIDEIVHFAQTEILKQVRFEEMDLCLWLILEDPYDAKHVYELASKVRR